MTPGSACLCCGNRFLLEDRERAAAIGDAAKLKVKSGLLSVQRLASTTSRLTT